VPDNDTDPTSGGDRRGQARGLAALGAELEKVTKRVETLDKALKREKPRISAGHSAAKELLDQRDKVREILERLVEVEEGVEDLAATVERLAGDDEGDDEPGIGSWMQADAEAEQTVAMLRDLGEWVATVLLHYPEVASNVRKCWWQHPDLVEHLLVLRACWGVAFDPASGTALARADWLERRLPVAVERLARVGRGCQFEHKPTEVPEAYVPPTEAELTAEAEKWAAREREVRPPTRRASVVPPAPGAGGVPGPFPPAGPAPGYPPQGGAPPGYGPGGGWPGQPYPPGS
jgi:hypothetical protein